MGSLEYENSSDSAVGIKLEESTSSENELSEKRNAKTNCFMRMEKKLGKQIN